VHSILLVAFSLVLTSMTFAGAAAHGERAGEVDFARRAVLASAAPTYCGLCLDAAACSPRERGIAAKARDPSRYRAPPEIFAVIDLASALTGVDFDYLLRAAALESSFNPTLAAATSTAVGLYQFIEQSWLYMVYSAGAELGLKDLANAIRLDEEEGGYEIDDEEAREEILRLRYDAELSAHFAALLARRNFETLARLLEREPEAGELYLAHVMGATGAAELIRLASESPEAKAAKHFRRAARANRAIFYQGKKPRSVAEVMEYLFEKYRRIPVYRAGGGELRLSAPPVWRPPLPVWRIGGDEIPFAMR